MTEERRLLRRRRKEIYSFQSIAKLRGDRTCVYVMQESPDGFIKIGKSDNPLKRLVDISMHNARKIEIRYILVNIDPDYEGEMHKIFGSFWVKGEWFKPEALEPIGRWLNHFKDNNRGFGRTKYDRIGLFDEYDIKEMIDKKFRVPNRFERHIQKQTHDQ